MGSQIAANNGVPALTKASSPPVFHPLESFIHSQQQTFPALSSTDESEVSSCSSESSDSEKTRCVTSTQMRAFLASCMSNMYRQEVPLYGDLLSIIGTINSDIIRCSQELISDDEISRLNVERHGAIRVGTEHELALLARVFRVFGMYPVGYYDLWKDASLPIHATAFRPVGKENLVKNPFRIFCSLLRMDLIRDVTTRQLAEELLGRRRIVSDRCEELLVKAEAKLPAEMQNDVEVKLTGLSRAEALEFVECVVDIFKWHPDTPVSLKQYRLLAETHPLVADIVSFRGPHINHLTPRTLDIDQVQKTMILQRIDAKEVVEGPPVRQNPIYLRQTSFHALSERVVFASEAGMEEGRHKARFGEIEARGQALTKKGSRLYDLLMTRVAEEKRRTEEERGGESVGKEECVEILERVFKAGFPDSMDALLRQGLGFFMFSVKDQALAKKMCQEAAGSRGCVLLADLVKKGALDAEPITYEDFLPASAAGIFQSNLPQQSRTHARATELKRDQAETGQHGARTRLETAVGGTILDYFTLYEEQQRRSLAEVAKCVGVEMQDVADEVERHGA